MCTEFILAFFYFSILFLFTFLLGNLLRIIFFDFLFLFNFQQFLSLSLRLKNKEKEFNSASIPKILSASFFFLKNEEFIKYSHIFFKDQVILGNFTNSQKFPIYYYELLSKQMKSIAQKTESPGT